MKLEKLFLPLAIVASIITVYLFLRRGGNSETGATVPNPTASGAGLTSGAQPVNYDIPGMNLQPSPLVVLANPNDANPGAAPYSGTPAYLNFNFGPSHDMAKEAPAKISGCGCHSAKTSGCSTCNSPNGYVDGGLTVPLSSSRARQIDGDSEWIEPALSNIRSYFLLTGDDSGVPTLTTPAKPAPVHTSPTLGSQGVIDRTVNNLSGFLRAPQRASGFAYQA